MFDFFLQMGFRLKFSSRVLKGKYSFLPQRKIEVIAADTSRNRTLEPVDTALLHKSPVQQLMGLIHAALRRQVLVTKPV